MQQRHSAHPIERPHAKSPRPLGLGETSGTHLYERTLDQRRIRHADRWRRQCQQLAKWLVRGEQRLRQLATDVRSELDENQRGHGRGRRADLAGRHAAVLIQELQTLCAELDAIEQRAAGRLMESAADRPWHALRDAMPSVGRRRALCRTIVTNMLRLAESRHASMTTPNAPLADEQRDASIARLEQIQQLVEESLEAATQLKQWLNSHVPAGGEPLLSDDHDETREGLV